MPNSRRNKNFRRLALFGGAVYGATRVIALLPPQGLEDMPDPLLYATVNGALLPVWIAAWGISAVVCAASIPKAELRYGLGSVVGLALAWGVIWFIGWMNDPSSMWWHTAVSYWAPCLIIGALMGHTIAPKEK